MPDTEEATTERLSRSFSRIEPLIDAIRAAYTLGLRDITVTSVPTRDARFVQYHLDAEMPGHVNGQVA